MENDAVQDAIDRAVAGKRQGKCWARLVLKGKALEFLRAIEELEDEASVHVSRQSASIDFRDTFGVDVASGQLGDHLNRKCRCRPKK